MGGNGYEGRPKVNSIAHLARVLIAEDHPMYADALEMALASIDRAIHIVKVSSLEDTCRALDASAFDLLLLDPGLTDSQGVATVAAIRGRYPQQRTLVISANDKLENQRRVRELGAGGFISKVSPLGSTVQAIKTVAAGDPWFASELSDGTGGAAIGLSPAQLKVMSELARGHSNKEIAYRLGIAEPTVKAHVSAILRALGAINRSQAILALRSADAV